MTKADYIKRSALNKLDSYIKNKLNEGWLLENIKLSKESCNLSDAEFKEVSVNISEFNVDLDRRYLFCKNRGIDLKDIR